MLIGYRLCSPCAALDRAAASLGSLAATITRARQHRRPAMKPREAQNEELRSLAASSLVKPYNEHVAAIAELLIRHHDGRQLREKDRETQGKATGRGGQSSPESEVVCPSFTTTRQKAAAP
jgi:hypothetical protein